MKNIIQMRPNFISMELVKNIACVGEATNKFEQKGIPHRSYSKLLKKHEAQFGFLGPLGVNWGFLEYCTI